MARSKGIKIKPAGPFLRKLLEAIGERGKDLAKAYLRATDGSETIQRDMSFAVTRVEETGAAGQIVVPYFWAQFHHDGRGRVTAPPGRYIVFFPNKHLDPRTLGGTHYPSTRAQQAQPGFHLTAEQFYEYLEINRARKALGQEPIMIVTRSVGPIKRPRPYFTEGLRSLPVEANQIALKHFESYLRACGLFETHKETISGTL